MFALLVAYVQGRGGVLDDRRKVVDSEPCGEPDPEAFDEDWEDAEEADQSDGVKDPGYKRVWGIVKASGAIVIGLLALLWFLGLCWRLGGWVGHNFLGVNGVLGNIAGVVGCLLLWIGLTMLGNRLTNARRDLRAQRGLRNLDDLTMLFHVVDQGRMCGACGFSIGEFEQEDDGCVRCPECGAAWKPELWEEFLNTHRNGSLAELSKKERRMYCGFDARMQLALVAEHETPEDRAALIRKCKGRMQLWDGFLLFLIFLILAGSIAATIGLAVGIGTTTGGLISASIGVIFLIGVLLYAVFVAKRSVWARKSQRYMRDRIDDRACPSCDCDLDTGPHPLDGSLVCEACGLAWNPETNRRRHHSRKRVPDEKYKGDPVFFKAP